MSFKKIGKRSISGEKGIGLLHRIFSQMEYGFHPSNQSVEAGVDGFIEIRDAITEQAMAKYLFFQSKVVSGRFTAETDTAFQYLCKQVDLDYWLSGNAPVLLIVSRPDDGEAYWVSVKDYFADFERRKERRVVFDKAAQRLTPESRGALAALARGRQAGLYLSPVPKVEELYSNMLHVSQYAPMMYAASTTYREPEEIWAWEREREIRLPGEWFLKSGQIYTCHDLREEPWRQLCDVGTIEGFGMDEWATSDDPDRVREFTRLLGRCLRNKLRPLGIGFNTDEGVYYFLPSKDFKPRSFSYQSIKRQTSRKMFSYYPNKTREFSYYRHGAFKGQFRRVEGEWYLIITPTYFYSSDGKAAYRFGESLLKGIKRLDKHAAVFGQVMTWAAVLTQGPGLFHKTYPFLSFDGLKRLQVNCGIEDADWLANADAGEAANASRELSDEGLFG